MATEQSISEQLWQLSTASGAEDLHGQAGFLICMGGGFVATTWCCRRRRFANAKPHPEATVVAASEGAESFPSSHPQNKRKPVNGRAAPKMAAPSLASVITSRRAAPEAKDATAKGIAALREAAASEVAAPHMPEAADEAPAEAPTEADSLDVAMTFKAEVKEEPSNEAVPVPDPQHSAAAPAVSAKLRLLPVRKATTSAKVAAKPDAKPVPISPTSAASSRNSEEDVRRVNRTPLERQILKLEKKQREVDHLRELESNGEALDSLQWAKLARLQENLRPMIAALKAEAASASFLPSQQFRMIAPLASRQGLDMAGLVNSAQRFGSEITSEQQTWTLSAQTKGKGKGKQKGKWKVVQQVQEVQEVQLDCQTETEQDVPGTYQADFGLDVATSSFDEMGQDRWETCWEWGNYGYCHRGETCRWEHPALNIGMLCSTEGVYMYEMPTGGDGSMMPLQVTPTFMMMGQGDSSVQACTDHYVFFENASPMADQNMMSMGGAVYYGYSGPIM